MKTRHAFAALGLATLLATSGAVAQPNGRGGDHAAMVDHGSMAQQGYMESMQTMQTAMMRAHQDRDPSRAWALQMIQHHRGAIAMSRVVLAHTRDPEIRRMANNTIRQQTREITEMQRWLDRHGGRQSRS